MSDEIKSRTELRQAKESSRKKNKKPKKSKGIFKKVFIGLIILGFAGLITGAGVFMFYASTAPELDEELLRDPISSDFLYANGDLMHTTGSEKREYVNYEDIPNLMEDAILATEDVRFYSHGGMDFYRLGGAVLANFRSGFGSQGASTITQQVIKNSFLKNEKTLKRKSQEAWLAFQLERAYEKEEIFEMYFNKILMSGNTYGFGTAANYFYGKELNELELHEVAMLAGLPQSPNGYNPYANPERAQKRRNIVLGLMHQHKKITKNEMETAQAIDVTSTLLPEEQRIANTSSKYPELVDVVMSELEEAGLGDIISEGVTIHTTFDASAQEAVREAVKWNFYLNDEVEAALTVLDTKTGEIIAIGAGRNYTTGLNFARQEKRQLGSTIKPLLSYGPAIEYLNWSTGQTVHDTEYHYNDVNKTPVRNVDNKFMGSMTAREALYRSRNVPAVKIFEEVGPTEANAFAAKLGIKLNDEYLPNALGGTKDEFSTIQLAGAYAAFGNNGVYTKPHAVKKIVFRDGKTEKNLKPKPTVAMKDSTAYMITDMLRDTMTKPGATGTAANISGLDIAGKTGTTNEAKDSWFAGYSTNYTIAAWSGYQKRKPMTQYPGERIIPQDLFKEVMTAISAGKDTPRFQKPASVEEATIVYLSEPLKRASASTPSHLKRTELFVKNSIPKETEVEKEEDIKLNAPTDLTAQFNESDQSVTLQWKHQKPDAELIEGDVEFTLYAQMDGGEQKEMTKTKDFTTTFTGTEPGKTYTFSVVATLADLTSDPATVSLQIEGAEEPEEEPEEPEENEEPEEDMKEPEEPEIEEPEIEEPEKEEQPEEDKKEEEEKEDESEPEQEEDHNEGESPVAHIEKKFRIEDDKRR